jgi:hypothetical protein
MRRHGDQQIGVVQSLGIARKIGSRLDAAEQDVGLESRRQHRGRRETRRTRRNPAGQTMRYDAREIGAGGIRAFRNQPKLGAGQLGQARTQVLEFRVTRMPLSKRTEQNRAALAGQQRLGQSTMCLADGDWGLAHRKRRRQRFTERLGGGVQHRREIGDHVVLGDRVGGDGKQIVIATRIEEGDLCAMPHGRCAKPMRKQGHLVTQV